MSSVRKDNLIGIVMLSLSMAVLAYFLRKIFIKKYGRLAEDIESGSSQTQIKHKTFVNRGIFDNIVNTKSPYEECGFSYSKSSRKIGITFVSISIAEENKLKQSEDKNLDTYNFLDENS